MKISCKQRHEGWLHIQRNATFLHVYIFDINMYTLFTYMRALISSAVLFYTSLQKGLRGTARTGQLGSACVRRGEGELPELAPARDSPWWLRTASEREGSDGADGEHKAPQEQHRLPRSSDSTRSPLFSQKWKKEAGCNLYFLPLKSMLQVCL